LRELVITSFGNTKETEAIGFVQGNKNSSKSV